MDTQHALTAEQASRMAVTAVTTDLEYWARCTSVDGRIGLNELTRILDVFREASTPEPDRTEAILHSVPASEPRLRAAQLTRAAAN
jgi:hypothetical protein